MQQSFESLRSLHLFIILPNNNNNKNNNKNYRITSTCGVFESLSHYCTEPAAKGLAKRDALAATKLYRALGLRIVSAAKSKYYSEALSHFENARDLYCSTGQIGEWQSLIGTVRATHSRKSGFLSAFERIVSGKSYSSSYIEEARARWKRLTS